MHPGCEPEGKKTPQITYVKCYIGMWYRNISLPMFQGLCQKAFRSSVWVRVQAAVFWCMLWIDVLDKASKSLGNGVGEGDDALGKKRGKLYWKTVAKKLSVRVVTQGWTCGWRTTWIFSWHSDRIPSRGSGGPQSPDNKFYGKDWNSSFQFKLC